MLYVDLVVVLLQLMMLSLTISAQSLLPPAETITDVDEALGRPSQDLEAEERGEVGLFPPPPSTTALRDSRGGGVGGDDGDDGEPANVEMERRVSEVMAGELEAARMDVVGVVLRQWDRNGSAIGGTRPREAATTRTVVRGRRWRVMIARQASRWD